MPNRSRRSAEDRAEARRRARLAARGEEIDQETDEEEEPAASRPAAGGGSLLTRLFPPAPPLPGRSDPMKGFAYAGPLPGVVGGLYLLSRNPLPWIVGGALWAVGQLFRSDDIIGVLALFISFAGLIGAGWFGWQRPWLFGVAAGVIGWLVLLGAYLGLSATFPTATLTSSPTPSIQAASPSAAASPSLVESVAPSPAASAASPEASPAPSGEGSSPNAGSVAAALVTELLFQAGLGGFAGWYGGYLRRRSAASSGGASASRNRRRR